jgi:hypothetical protein
VGIRTSSHIAKVFHAHNAKDDYRKVVLFPGIQDPPSHYGLLMIIRVMRSFALPGEACQLRGNLSGAASVGEHVGDRWRRRTSPGAIVRRMRPELASPGPVSSWIDHRHPRLIAEDPRSAAAIQFPFSTLADRFENCQRPVRGRRVGAVRARLWLRLRDVRSVMQPTLKIITWSRHSRRIEPMTFSAYGPPSS